MKKTLLLAPLAAAALIVSQSCVSQSRSWGDEESTGVYSETSSGSAGAASSSKSASGPSTAQAREASSPRSAPAGMARSTLAYPTGDKKTSAILLDKLAPREIIAGQAFEYEIQVSNLTSMSLDNVTVTETLPANFNMTGSVPQAVKAAGGSASWNLGEISAKGEKTIRIKGTAREAGMITTCSSVAYNTGVCMSIPVVKPALQLVANGTSKAMTCEPVQYTYKVTNSGTGTARNVVVKVPLPAGITVNGKTAVSKTIPSLAAGESMDFTVKGDPSKRGDFTHTATATAEGGLTATASPIKTTICEPVLKITKTGSKKEFLGKDLRYEITVQNTGDAPARNTILTDRLPAGTRFESATDNGRSSGGTVSWNLGTIAPERHQEGHPGHQRRPRRHADQQRQRQGRVRQDGRRHLADRSDRYSRRAARGRRCRGPGPGR